MLVGFCFSLIRSYLCIFSESISIRDGEGRAELVVVVAGLGLKEVAQQ